MAADNNPVIVNSQHVDNFQSALKKVLENKAAVLKRALPGKEEQYLSYFLNVGYTAIYRQPELLSCEINSVFRSILLACQLNLVPNTPMGYSSLVKHWNGKAQVNEAVLYIQFQGHLELMYRNSRVELIEVQPVYHSEIEKGLFIYELGSNPAIRHTLDFTVDRDKETPALIYVVAHLKGTPIPIIKIMTAAEIFKRRAVSPSWKYYVQCKEKGQKVTCVWADWELDMMLKTALLSARKKIPQSIESAYAADIENSQAMDRPALIHSADLTTIIDDKVINPEIGKQDAGIDETKSDRLNEKLKEKNGAAKTETTAEPEPEPPPADIPEPEPRHQPEPETEAMITDGQIRGLEWVVKQLQGKPYQDQTELENYMLRGSKKEMMFIEASAVIAKLNSRFKKYEAKTKEKPEKS